MYAHRYAYRYNNIHRYTINCDVQVKYLSQKKSIANYESTYMAQLKSKLYHSDQPNNCNLSRLLQTFPTYSWVLRTYINTVTQRLILLKFIYLAVNVCSNLMGCFEVEPLSSTPMIIKWDPPRNLPLLLVFFSMSRRLYFTHCFCLARSGLFAFNSRQFFS